MHVCICMYVLCMYALDMQVCKMHIPQFHVQQLIDLQLHVRIISHVHVHCIPLQQMVRVWTTTMSYKVLGKNTYTPLTEIRVSIHNTRHKARTANTSNCGKTKVEWLYMLYLRLKFSRAECSRHRRLIPFIQRVHICSFLWLHWNLLTNTVRLTEICVGRERGGEGRRCSG